MTRLRAALFDVGNTLSHVNHPQIQRVLQALGALVPLPAIRVAECRARVRLDSLLGGATPHMENLNVFRRFCQLIGEEIGTLDQRQCTQLVDALEAYNRAGTLWDLPDPAVPTVVAQLRQAGLAIGVISNSDGTVADLLRAQGVSDLFDIIVDSGVIGVAKPDPAIFHHAVAQLDVQPAEAIYVGDMYSIDILGSRRAGLAGILLDPLGVWPVADCLKVPDLAAAGAYIHALATRPRTS